MLLLATHLTSETSDSVILRLGAIHRPSPEWNHEEFIIAAQVLYGTRPIGQPVRTQPFKITNSLYPRIVFENAW